MGLYWGLLTKQSQYLRGKNIWLFDKQRNNFDLNANVFENIHKKQFFHSRVKNKQPPPPKKKENIPLMLNRKRRTMVNKYLHCKHYKNELMHFKTWNMLTLKNVFKSTKGVQNCTSEIKVEGYSY